MARPPAAPRIVQWHGKTHLFYFDHGQRKTVRKCVEGVSKEDVRDLLKDHTIKFLEQRTEALRGFTVKTAYDKPVLEALAEYLVDVRERVKEREANPNARAGITAATAYDMKLTVSRFVAWLESSGNKTLATGELSAVDLQKFFRSLGAMTSHHGAREVRLKASTMNKQKRNLCTALHWLNRLRPKLFPDIESLECACKAQRIDPPEPTVYTPAQLGKFYAALVEREQADFKRVVSDKRRGPWAQTVTATSATPQSRLFLMLALIGCRLGEALIMKWSDVDLNRGRITIRAQKTGKRRIVPLTAAPEAEIAPGLLGLMKQWKLEAGQREYVLAHLRATEERPNPVPLYVKCAWVDIGKKLGVHVHPQALRQNFVAYAASLGVPELVSSGWSGHSAAVAARYYRAQVLERHVGSSFEAAMGLINSAVAQVPQSA